MRFLILFVAMCFSPAAGVFAADRDYPNRTVRVIVPYGPGGGMDIIGRPLLKHLTELLKQPFIIENRPGAGTTVGSGQAARAIPDGYTFLLTFRAISLGPSIYKNLPYDPEKDFEPIVLIVLSSDILSVHPSVPGRNFKQFLAYVKKHPNKLNYASSGTGSDPHLNMEILLQKAGIAMSHIPYGGGGTAVPALMSGEVDAMLVPGSIGVPFVKSGRIRALAVSASSRAASLPEVPTLQEEGIRGVSGSWAALFAPKGTPQEIIMKLNSAVNKSLANNELRDFYLERFLVPLGGAPDALGEQLRADVSNWRKVVKDVGIKPE